MLPVTIAEWKLGARSGIAPNPRFAGPTVDRIGNKGIEMPTVRDRFVVVTPSACLHRRIRLGRFSRDLAVVRIVQIDMVQKSGVAVAVRIARIRSLTDNGNQAQTRQHNDSFVLTQGSIHDGRITFVLLINRQRTPFASMADDAIL